MVLMFLVHSSSFSLVRHKTNFLHYESPCNSTFLKLAVTAETAVFTRVSVSPGHSGSLRPVRKKTGFLRHEWRNNVTPQKVPRTTYTSCFTITFVFCPFCKIKSCTTPSQYSLLWVTLELNVKERPNTSHTSSFMMILMSWRFESCMTQDNFSPLRVSTLQKRAGTIHTSWFTFILKYIL